MDHLVTYLGFLMAGAIIVCLVFLTIRWLRKKKKKPRNKHMKAIVVACIVGAFATGLVWMAGLFMPPALVAESGNFIDGYASLTQIDAPAEWVVALVSYVSWAIGAGAATLALMKKYPPD